jgi:hypothetical protein
MISLRCVDYYHVFCTHVWCDVNFYHAMFVCIARVDEQVTKDQGTQQEEIAEQELIEGKL